MSSINTKLASQVLNAVDTGSVADALEFYVTTPAAGAASASVWFAALRTAAGAATTAASVAIDSVQLAAEDTASIIALTAGELSIASHMRDTLKVAMRKTVGQSNLDQQDVYRLFRGDANFAN